MSNQRLLMLLGVLLLAVVLALFYFGPPVARGASALPTVQDQSGHPPGVGPTGAACDQKKLEELERRALEARANWAARLAPETFKSYTDARDKFVKYARNCADALGLDVPKLVNKVIGPVKPSAAPPSEPKAPPREAPRAPGTRQAPAAPTDADLILSKTDDPDPVTAGQTLTYTLLITNTGPSTASNVVIEDNLPAEVEVVSVSSSSGPCNAGTPGDPSAPTRCNFGPVPAGGTRVMVVVVKVKTDIVPDPLTGQKIIHNDAWTYSDNFDPDNSNNLATQDTTVNVGVVGADLSITKTGPATVGAGETIAYTLIVTNTGPSMAKNVVVLDYIPAELTHLRFTPSKGNCMAGVPGNPLRPARCNLGTMNAGATESIPIVAQVKNNVPGDTDVFNDVQVSSDTSDPDTSDNIASVSTVVQATCTAAPDVPNLISPANGATVPRIKVLLDWADTNCALDYEVEVRALWPTGPVVVERTVVASQYATKKLAKGRTYFWLIRACNGVGCTSSAQRAFKIPP